MSQNAILQHPVQHPERITAYETCKLHDFPASLCPFCRDMRIKELENEVNRLKNGQFTAEELQNLCHTTSEEECNAFGLGCLQYQLSLFGPAKVKDLYVKLKAEFISLFTCKACGATADDDGRIHHGICCAYAPYQFESIEEFWNRTKYNVNITPLPKD